MSVSSQISTQSDKSSIKYVPGYLIFALPHGMFNLFLSDTTELRPELYLIKVSEYLLQSLAARF